MAKKLNKSNLDMYRQIFKAIDKDGSGAIDEDELVLALNQLGIQMDREVVRGMIELVDEDFNGEMDEKEFVHFLYICENAAPSDVKTILFLAADEDYSQTIDGDELLKILKKLGVAVTEADVAEIMDALVDNEEDHTISYEMFCALMEELMN